jgi:hypothetical protein
LEKILWKLRMLDKQKRLILSHSYKSKRKKLKIKHEKWNSKYVAWSILKTSSRYALYARLYGIYILSDLRAILTDTNSEIPKSIKNRGFCKRVGCGYHRKILENNFKAVQLHGKESADFCLNLKSEFSKISRHIEIIKVFSCGFWFECLMPLKTLWLLLFWYQRKLPGGNGTIDWMYCSTILHQNRSLIKVLDLKKASKWNNKN